MREAMMLCGDSTQFAKVWYDSSRLSSIGTNRGNNDTGVILYWYIGGDPKKQHTKTPYSKSMFDFASTLMVDPDTSCLHTSVRCTSTGYTIFA